MLINFTVANYRSIKEPITLSMEAENRILGLEKENLIEIPDGRKLINAAAIYGANASGKSNLIKAMKFMQSFVVNSSVGAQQGDPISVEPFLLGDNNEEKRASHFEIECLLDEVVYEYGFEVTTEKVTKEWLYGWPNGRKTIYFTREKQKLTKLSTKYFNEGRGLETKTRSNALFLSTVSQLNGEKSKLFVEYFKGLNGPSSYIPSLFVDLITMLLMMRPKILKKVEGLMCLFDPSIKALRVKETQKTPGHEFVKRVALSEFSSSWRVIKEDPKAYTLKVIHQTQSGNEVEFDLDQESSGTQRLFALLGPIIASFMGKGAPHIFDEIESSMHPLLTIELLRLFQVNKHNASKSQVIFSTHDTNLLSQRVGLLRRDQIWFTEKRKDASTDLYCLSEFKPKNDAAYDKNYLRGKYGAVPYFGDWAGRAGYME